MGRVPTNFIPLLRPFTEAALAAADAPLSPRSSQAPLLACANEAMNAHYDDETVALLHYLCPRPLITCVWYRYMLRLPAELVEVDVLSSVDVCSNVSNFLGVY